MGILLETIQAWPLFILVSILEHIFRRVSDRLTHFEGQITDLQMAGTRIDSKDLESILPDHALEKLDLGLGHDCVIVVRPGHGCLLLLESWNLLA